MVFRLTTLTFAMLILSAAGIVRADPKPNEGEADFDRLSQLIKRQPGESRWMEIDWHPHVWEARQIAAKEGKPLFFMAGSGGAPTAGC